MFGVKFLAIDITKGCPAARRNKVTGCKSAAKIPQVLLAGRLKKVRTSHTLGRERHHRAMEASAVVTRASDGQQASR